MANTMRIKRTTTVKSVVTDKFREQASGELSSELTLIDSQLGELDRQYQEMLKQLEAMAQQGQSVKNDLDSLNQQAQGKRNQLSGLKMDVSTRLSNLNKVNNGDHVITGVLETYIDINVGDNIYDKVRNSEIIVEDGVIKEFRG